MRRFYKARFLSNEVPLQVFEVQESLTYLFQDINVGTAYLFCVCIEDHQALIILFSYAYKISNNAGTTGGKHVV